VASVERAAVDVVSVGDVVEKVVTAASTDVVGERKVVGVVVGEGA
jgi:hypothetical protein